MSILCLVSCTVSQLLWDSGTVLFSTHDPVSKFLCHGSSYMLLNLGTLTLNFCLLSFLGITSFKEHTMFTYCDFLLWPTDCVFTLVCCLHILLHNWLHVCSVPMSLWGFWVLVNTVLNCPPIKSVPHMPSSLRNWAITQDPGWDKLNHPSISL